MISGAHQGQCILSIVFLHIIFSARERIFLSEAGSLASMYAWTRQKESIIGWPFIAGSEAINSQAVAELERRSNESWRRDVMVVFHRATIIALERRGRSTERPVADDRANLDHTRGRPAGEIVYEGTDGLGAFPPIRSSILWYAEKLLKPGNCCWRRGVSWLQPLLWRCSNQLLFEPRVSYILLIRPISRFFLKSLAGLGKIRLKFRLAVLFSSGFRLTYFRLIFRLSRFFLKINSSRFLQP